MTARIRLVVQTDDDFFDEMVDATDRISVSVDKHGITARSDGRYLIDGGDKVFPNNKEIDKPIHGQLSLYDKPWEMKSGR